MDAAPTSFRHRASTWFRSNWPGARPWCALALLFFLFGFPDMVRDAGLRPKSLRISGDLLAILSLAAGSFLLLRAGRKVRIALGSYAMLLFAFRLDRMIMGFLMQQEPLLYDQLFMVRHLLVLISDLWSPSTLGVVGGFLAIVGLFAWISRGLLRSALTLLDEQHRLRTFRVAYWVWIGALLLSVSDTIGVTRHALVDWLSPVLAHNTKESIATYRAAVRGLSHSPYDKYGKIKLAKKPDVDIYVVESYGRMLWDNPKMRTQHLDLLGRLEQRLTAAGWEAVSAFSASSVRGARSWLADASMLVGAPVRYEAIFHHLIEEIAHRPTLVSFFNQQGYETVLVGPGERERPGVRVTNPYGYRRAVRFDTLKYTGPTYGFGLVPDQYSLSFVEENVVKTATRPRFMNFHLVTSHAPWWEIPTLVDDWHSLNQLAGKRNLDTKRSISKAPFVHFDRTAADTYFRPLKGSYVNGYVTTIGYDLELLTRLLEQSQASGRLVILIGDHQPPLVAAGDPTYDSPVHVLARDPALLAEFRSRGFKPGLRLPRDAPTVMGHAGMFSLLARALVRCCGQGPKMPPFLPRGQELIDIGKHAATSTSPQ